MTIRENQLHQVIAVLFNELQTFTDTRHLEREIRRSGLGWTLPSSIDFFDEDQWLSIDQIAFELGYSPSAIRNWPSRYGIKPIDGRYRWGDIQRLIIARNMRRHATSTGK